MMGVHNVFVDTASVINMSKAIISQWVNILAYLEKKHKVEINFMTLQRWAKKDCFPVYKIANRIYSTEEDIDQWINEKKELVYAYLLSTRKKLPKRKKKGRKKKIPRGRRKVRGLLKKEDKDLFWKEVQLLTNWHSPKTRKEMYRAGLVLIDRKMSVKDVLKIIKRIAKIVNKEVIKQSHLVKKTIIF